MSPSPDNQARLTGAARGLDENGLVAVAWSGFALATCFAALRCYGRFTETGKLHLDDYWILLALFFLLVNAILQTLQAHSLYYLVYAGAGMVSAGEELLVQGNIYVRYQFVIIVLFWTVLWCVKASFLSLYWRLFEGLKWERILLWAVAIFAILAYIGCWITSVLTCHPPSTYFHFGQCSKPIDTEGSNISISFSTAVDIGIDIMIMVLPLHTLSTLQVTGRQKAGLAGIFSVALIIVACALVRLTQIVTKERADPVGLAVWGLVESSISVVVGSLPPLKAFFSRTLSRTLNRSKGAQGGGSSRGRWKYDAQEEQSLSKSEARVGAIPLEDRSHSPYAVGSQVRPENRSSVSTEWPMKHGSVEERVVSEREYY